METSLLLQSRNRAARAAQESTSGTAVDVGGHRLDFFGKGWPVDYLLVIYSRINNRVEL